MKKSTISALVIIIPLITIVSISLIAYATGDRNQIPHPQYVLYDIHCKSATVNNGEYNISVSVNATQSESIQKIILNPGDNKGEQAIEEISGLNTYLNGTAVSTELPLNYHVRSGDYLQVNFIVPYTEAYQNQTIFVIQSTDSGGPYTQIQTLNLTQNPPT